jgi:uncharacterized membrane protein
MSGTLLDPLAEPLATDDARVAPAIKPSEAELDERNLAFVIYALLFISPFSLGLTALVAVVLAYIRKNNTPHFVQGHFRFQIKSFWVVFVLWATATFVAVICTVFLTLALANLIFTQYDISDWRNLDINFANLDTSQISVTQILAIASGYVVSGLLTVAATVFILVTSIIGFVRLSHNKSIGKRRRNA